MTEPETQEPKQEEVKTSIKPANKLPLAILMLFGVILFNVIGFRFGVLGLLSSRSDMALWGAFPLAGLIFWLDWQFTSFYMKWIKE